MCTCAWYSAYVHTGVCVIQYEALYTACMTVTLQSSSSRVSRAKNVTPLKHAAAGLCWNLSLSLNVFTAAQQRQQNAMLTSHSEMTSIYCARLRSNPDFSGVWQEEDWGNATMFVCVSSPVYKLLTSDLCDLITSGQARQVGMYIW